MRGWLVDTNVVSELRKPNAERRVTRFVDAQPAEMLFTSEITFAEIRFGIAKNHANTALQATIQTWLDDTLRPFFAERVLGITEHTLFDWRVKVEQGRSRGYTFPQPDLFIAVLAERHDLVIVSRDVTPFKEAGVAVFNPWKDLYITPSGVEHDTARMRLPTLLDRLSRL